jgi:PAS domain S-box-containing protein
VNTLTEARERLHVELHALRARLAALENVATCHRQLEEALQGSERRFRAMIEHSTDAISLLDPRGTILYASPSTERVLGYTPEEFVGHNAFDYMHPDDLGRVQGLFAELLGRPGGTLRDQFRYRAKSGAWLWVEGCGTNLLHDPAVGALVSNYRDVTERRQAQEECLRLNRELGARVAELRQALAQVKQLEGLLPICGWCKRVRADGDYWQKVEDYLTSHTDLQFTHGICPDCMSRVMQGEEGAPPPSGSDK